MLFNSIDFLIFFPIVVLAYFVMPVRLRHLWLLAASYFFYMCWNAKYALLILFSTAVTFASGLLMEAVRRSGRPEAARQTQLKWIVAVSFITNLAILFCFKYLNFTLDILSGLLAAAHIRLRVPTFDILLPVGISFYTFQALSYTMDVYRGEIYAEKNFFRYALFVSFFPQLVAGPIERSKNLLKQLAVPKKFDFDAAREGLLLMIWGFFLKIVIADRIAIFVDNVYGSYAAYNGSFLALATVLFAFQIYCDFSGYSTIAMGAAKVLGITLMENFDAPYLAASVAEFWRRWHISLTSWFKDYLYIPLGGSRKGKVRKYINKIIVFLVSGLWHGADLSYVVWGLLNGFYQVAGEMLEPLRCRTASALRLNRDAFPCRVIRVGITFLLVDLSWVFFRADSIGSALAIFRIMASPWDIRALLTDALFYAGLGKRVILVLAVCLLILLAADLCKLRGIRVREVILRQPFPVRCLVISCSIAAIALFGIWGSSLDQANFIYFQF